MARAPSNPGSRRAPRTVDPEKVRPVTGSIARKVSMPLRALAVVVALGVSFLTGEEVGAGLARTRVLAEGQALLAKAPAPSPSGSDLPDAVPEAPGIGSDCNTNYR